MLPSKQRNQSLEFKKQDTNNQNDVDKVLIPKLWRLVMDPQEANWGWTTCILFQNSILYKNMLYSSLN